MSSTNDLNYWAGFALVALLLIGMAVPAATAADRKMKVQAQPVYPELAKKMNVSGAVRIEVVINPAGTVKSAKALGGHPLLIEAALDAAKKSKFETASEESTQVVIYNFTRGQ